MGNCYSNSDDKVKLYLELGNKHHDEGRYQLAIDCYEIALETNSNSGELYYYKARSFYKTGRYQTAVICFEEAIKKEAKLAPLSYIYIGCIFFEMEDYQKALCYYDKAMVLEDNILAFVQKGRTLHILKRYNDALACYNEALSFDQNLPFVLFNKGQTLKSLKREEEAMLCFKKAGRLLNKNNSFYDEILTEIEILNKKLNLTSNDDEQENLLKQSSQKTIPKKHHKSPSTIDKLNKVTIFLEDIKEESNRINEYKIDDVVDVVLSGDDSTTI